MRGDYTVMSSSKVNEAKGGSVLKSDLPLAPSFLEKSCKKLPKEKSLPPLLST
jgi:hypothetical protein